jgi:hypothetical protein
MVATCVEEPTWLAYRKNGIEKGVTQDGVLKIDHVFAKVHPVICCDHAEANDWHKVTAFGEAEFRVNVSDRIKITAFGEAKLRYMGNPAIVKGIHIGEMDLAKLD